MNGFVDLDVTLRLPGAPDDEQPAGLAKAAVMGGVDVVIVGVDGTAPTDATSLAATAAMLRVSSPATPLLLPAVRPLLDGQLADLGSLGWSSATGVGGVVTRPVWRLLSPVDDALLLRRIGELARTHNAVVVVPSTDGALSQGGIAVEGAVATRLGIAALPEAAEAIGVGRIIEIAKLTGASFHVVGVFTAAGAAAIAAAPPEVTGSVRAVHLLVDEGALLARPYDTRLLRSPPLPTARSRLALIEAVRAGTLMVGSGHVHVPRRERDLEMSRATPGGTSLSSTARVLISVLGLEALVAAYRDGPRRLLGLPAASAPPTVTVVDGSHAGHDDDLVTLLTELRP